MPMLPSGRQVAITLAPLADIIAHVADGDNLKRILNIENPEGLYPYTEVNYLQMPECFGDTGLQTPFVQGSLPRPENMVVVSSGLRVSDWDTLTADWTEADKASFREFIEGRAMTLFNNGMAEVARVRDAKERLERERWDAVLSVMRNLEQEEWLDGIDSPEWDDYDMLAAIGLIVATISTKPDIYGRHPAPFDRATGMWSMLAGHYDFLGQSITLSQKAKELAQKWRDRGDLDAVVDDRRIWLHNQLVIECVNLWNHTGETLERLCPGAYGILTLVSLSPEGTAAS
jgi:hypothetical protein